MEKDLQTKVQILLPYLAHVQSTYILSQGNTEQARAALFGNSIDCLKAITEALDLVLRIDRDGDDLVLRVMNKYNTYTLIRTNLSLYIVDDEDLEGE